jgi:hypothetical protein
MIQAARKFFSFVRFVLFCGDDSAMQNTRL